MKFYKQKLFSFDSNLFIGLIILGVYDLLVVGSPMSLPVRVIYFSLMGFVGWYTLYRKKDLVIDEEKIVITRVLAKYLPIFKPVTIHKQEVEEFALRLNADRAFFLQVYNTGHLLLVRTKDGKIHWVIFFSAAQKMNHLRDDVVACLGRDKLVKRLPIK